MPGLLSSIVRWTLTEIGNETPYGEVLLNKYGALWAALHANGVAVSDAAPLPVKLSSDPTIDIGEVDQGAKADAATDAWYFQLVTALGDAITTTTGGGKRALDVALLDMVQVAVGSQAVDDTHGFPIKGVAGATAVPVSAAALTDGTQKAKVTDQLLSGIAEGTTTAGSDAALFTSQTGGGYAMMTNTDASVSAYLTFSGATASNSKFLFQAGASLKVPIADVTKIRVYSAGSPVISWAFLQVA